MSRRRPVPYTHDEGLRGFHVIMAAITALVVVVDLLFARTVHAEGLGYLLAPLPVAIPAAALYLYCKWRRFEKFAHIVGISLWVFTPANAISALVQICARTSAPLIDGSLAAADHWLGLSTGAVVLWVAHVPHICTPLEVAYALLPLLAMSAAFIPILCGQAQVSQKYLLQVMLVAIMAAALFAKWPALGPWTVYGFPPTTAQKAYISHLLFLRSLQPARIDLGSSGIITFPSCHVALAFLSALTLWRIRRIRWFAVLLGVAICLSTITTGWHYFSDGFGGMR